MSSSNRPSVFGLVSMMPATSSSSTDRSAAMSTQPAVVARDGRRPRSRPRVTDAGLVPWAESGMITLWRTLAPGLVPGPHQQQPGQLAGRAGRRLQRGGGHAGHLAERLLELDQQRQPALGRARPGPPGGRRPGPGSPATVSHTFGLYFMVHEPERVGAEVDRELAVATAG